MPLFSNIPKKEVKEELPGEQSGRFGEKLAASQPNKPKEKVHETSEKYSQQKNMVSKLPDKIGKKAEEGKLSQMEKEILMQREPAHQIISNSEHIEKHMHKEFIKTGIPGFDELFDKGIPKGTATLLCGGPGSGKTIFGLQALYNAAMKGEKCIYMTFEENEDKLRQHMEDFGWSPEELEKEGKLVIKRHDVYAITRSVEALLEKAKGELLIDVTPVLFPEGFIPDRVVIDSLTAIASAFYGREETYRIYIEQLFRMMEGIGATSFLITESTQIPVKITESGVEEFLADGVIILYNIKSGNVRESAIEVLKMRGTSFQKKIVAMKIENGKGIVVYPEQEVFSGS